MPLVKRTDVLINGCKYYDTITQREETIEFYNYYNHLKKIGFTWEHSSLEFKYEITLSSDEKKKCKKKITMDKITRRKLAIDESRILLVTRNNHLVSVSSEYVNNIIQYFKVHDSKIKDLHHRRNAKIFTNPNTTGSEREKFRRDYNQRATN